MTFSEHMIFSRVPSEFSTMTFCWLQPHHSFYPVGTTVAIRAHDHQRYTTRLHFPMSVVCPLFMSRITKTLRYTHTHSQTDKNTYTHTFWPCNLRHEKNNNPPRPRSFQFPWAIKNTRSYHLIVLLGWKRFPYYGSVRNSPFHQQSTIIYHVDLHNFHC